jgi:hypothetical protein
VSHRPLSYISSSPPQVLPFDPPHPTLGHFHLWCCCVNTVQQLITTFLLVSCSTLSVSTEYTVHCIDFCGRVGVANQPARGTSFHITHTLGPGYTGCRAQVAGWFLGSAAKSQAGFIGQWKSRILLFMKRILLQLQPSINSLGKNNLPHQFKKIRDVVLHFDILIFLEKFSH